MSTNLFAKNEDLKAVESKFTKEADAAFDEFCKKYLNSTNGFFINTDFEIKQSKPPIEIKMTNNPSSLITHTNNDKDSKENLKNNSKFKIKEQIQININPKPIQTTNGQNKLIVSNHLINRTNSLRPANTYDNVLNSLNLNSMNNLKVNLKNQNENNNNNNNNKEFKYLKSNIYQSEPRNFVLNFKKNRNSENFDLLKNQQQSNINLNSTDSNSSKSSPEPNLNHLTFPSKNYYLRSNKHYFYNNTNDIFIDSSKSDLSTDESIKFEIPKKKNFSDEFYSKAKLSSYQISTQQSYLNNFNQENVSKSILKQNYSTLSDISPYIVANSPIEVQKPFNRLGFKIVSCGMSKLGKLPIPKENFFLDKGDFGDDAGFISENQLGSSLGVADGATGNCMLGYDPGDFSRNLMKSCAKIFSNENKMLDAKSLLLKAYENVQDKTCYGSCTACILTLDHSNSIMTAANVGDSGYCVIRNGKIIHYSVPQRLTFECPRQLDSYPWKEKSRKMGISYTEIIGKDTELEKFEVMKDDLVIISSDGLFDNLEHYEIEEICFRSKSLMDAVENLVYRSVKYYRKPDDLLVLIAKVVNDKVSSTIQQKYTQDPYLN